MENNSNNNSNKVNETHVEKMPLFALNMSKSKWNSRIYRQDSGFDEFESSTPRDTRKEALAKKFRSRSKSENFVFGAKTDKSRSNSLPENSYLNENTSQNSIYIAGEDTSKTLTNIELYLNETNSSLESDSCRSPTAQINHSKCVNTKSWPSISYFCEESLPFFTANEKSCPNKSNNIPCFINRWITNQENFFKIVIVFLAAFSFITLIFLNIFLRNEMIERDNRVILLEKQVFQIEETLNKLIAEKTLEREVQKNRKFNTKSDVWKTDIQNSKPEVSESAGTNSFHTIVRRAVNNRKGKEKFTNTTILEFEKIKKTVRILNKKIRNIKALTEQELPTAGFVGNLWQHIERRTLLIPGKSCEVMTRWPKEPVACRGAMVNYPKPETPFSFFLSDTNSTRGEAIVNQDENDKHKFNVSVSGFYQIHLLVAFRDKLLQHSAGIYVNDKIAHACQPGGFRCNLLNTERTSHFRICSVYLTDMLMAGDIIETKNLKGGMELKLEGKRQAVLRIVQIHKSQTKDESHCLNKRGKRRKRCRGN